MLFLENKISFSLEIPSQTMRLHVSDAKWKIGATHENY